MHEYSIVQALIERVGEAARSRGASAVHRVSVRVGELSGLDVTLFTTAYATFRERTICADAVLEVEVVPVRWQCPQCAADIAPGQALRCARCGTAARLAHGDEIMLDRIELEVP
jgi:hydrogenase nickel incorporation protein HypA/HybF